MANNLIAINNYYRLGMVNLDRIRELCKERNISIKQLSSELGLSERAVQLMLRQNTTKISTLESIAKYFDVEIAYFFTSEENESKRFTEGVLASINFLVVHDIWLLFRVEEESLIVKSERLNSFINANLATLDADTTRSEIFSLAFNNELIQRLYNSLDKIEEPFAIELIGIIKDLMNEAYCMLTDDNSMKSFIEKDFIKKKDIKAVLNTYFVEFSILGKFYEKIIDNNSNYRV